MCPDAVIVPPRFDRYQQVSATIMKVFSDFSPDVQALSLDEAFLDMTGSEQLFGDPQSIGRRLKAAVREATNGLTASVGVSATKYVAKVASASRKPDGLTVGVSAGAGRKAWLAPLSVSWLWGARAEPKHAFINSVCIRSGTWPAPMCGFFRRSSEVPAFTSTRSPKRRIHGRSLDGEHPRASGEEHTLDEDVREKAAIKFHLRRSADTIGKPAQKKELRGLRCRREAQDRRLPDYNAPTPAQRTDRRCG